MKVSVIDLGYNSVKLVNYDVRSDNSFQAYQQDSVKVQLGDGLGKSGCLTRQAIQRTFNALELFGDIINVQSIKYVLPIATSAVREAANRMEFLKEAYEKTGFLFKVLSEKEEALYSYVGAVRSTCIPTTLFFDLGGGSLEMIYAENFRIKKTLSLPLGVLRMSQAYDNRDGVLTKNNYEKIERYVLKLLPEREKLDMSLDTSLIGTGGTLRALARYDQEIKNYPLNKIHNYRIDYESVDSINKKLRKMSPNEIARIDSIGNRVETITIGSAIIKLIMEKFRLGKILVSTQGLREGTISIFLHNPKAYYNGNISQDAAQRSVKLTCEPKQIAEFTKTLTKPLISFRFINEKEELILVHAREKIAELSSITNLHNLFYMVIDEESPYLSHREQLISGLSIVRARKAKVADSLFERYESILKPQNRKSVEKIAACILLSDILERTRAKLKLSNQKDEKKFLMQIRTGKSPFPKMLFQRALKDFEAAFDISVDSRVSYESGKKISQKVSI